MQLIDGKAIADQIKQEIAQEVADIKARGEKTPHLAVIIVGHDGGSETYVAHKVKSCEQVGFKSTKICFEADVTEEELLKKIEELDGIQAYLDSMVKLPENAAENFYKEHVDEFFTQLSASHILAQFPKDAPVTEEAKQATKERILAIQKELKDGKDFAELAKEKSDCPSKEDGGNLGSFSKGQMVPAFEAALLEMKPGEISDIVETEFGYHIIKAGETKVVPFEEVKERIEEHLKQEAEQEVAETTFTKLLEEAKIKWNLPEPEFPKDEEEEAPAEE